MPACQELLWRAAGAERGRRGISKAHPLYPLKLFERVHLKHTQRKCALEVRECVSMSFQHI